MGEEALVRYETAVDAENDADARYLEGFKPELCERRIGADELTTLIGLNDKPMTWLEVLTACFAYLREYAQENEFAGNEVNGVKLTHPVNFPNTELYRQAAEAAGFTEISFIMEPEAAYLGYNDGGQELGSNVLVFDMGGGTLDVALLQKAADGWRIPHAPLRLDTAGVHIDMAVCASLYEELQQAGIVNEQGDDGIEVQFKRYARINIKEELGKGLRESVRVNYTSDRTDARLRCVYGRERFEAVLERVMHKVYDQIRRYVTNLPVTPDVLLMVGGSSRLKTIQTKLRELFPELKIFSPADGGSLVAKGALLAASASPVEAGIEKEELLQEKIIRAFPLVEKNEAIARLSAREIYLSKFDDALLSAIEQNDAELVNLFVCAGVDVNKADNDRSDEGILRSMWRRIRHCFVSDNAGRTPLCRAASLGYENCLSVLLSSRNANINQLDRCGYAPLHLAVIHEHEDCVSLLLETRGIDVNLKSSFGNTPLYYAADADDSSVLEELLACAAIDVNLACVNERTSLHRSVCVDRADNIRMLLNVPGINVNAKDEAGCTPLILAAEAEQWTGVQMLLNDSRVKVNATCPKSRNVLHYAAFHNRSDVVKQILECGKVDVNKADEEKRTPLHLAAEQGAVNTLKLLLDQRNINTLLKDAEGRTALYSAVMEKHEECVKLLVDSEPKLVNVSDVNGITPLMMAAEVGSLSVINVLLDVPGIDVNKADNNGKTVLFYAVDQSNDEILERLLQEKSLKVNKKLKSGEGVLHYVIDNNDPTSLEMLLMRPGIELNGVYEGRTPLSLAVFRYGRSKCVALLSEKAGVMLNKVDADGKTPLQLAKDLGRTECISILEAIEKCK